MLPFPDSDSPVSICSTDKQSAISGQWFYTFFWSKGVNPLVQRMDQYFWAWRSNPSCDIQSKGILGASELCGCLSEFVNSSRISNDIGS